MAGENYGQGSSRERAASGLMVLGVKAVIAKSFSRIHYSNLLSYGIAPLMSSDASDFARINQGDRLLFSNARSFLSGGIPAQLSNLTQSMRFEVAHSLSPRQSRILLEGGILIYAKMRQGSET